MATEQAAKDFGCAGMRSHNGGGWMMEFHWNYLRSLHTTQARVFLAHTQTCCEEEEEEDEKEEKKEEEEEEEAVPAQPCVITISPKVLSLSESPSTRAPHLHTRVSWIMNLESLSCAWPVPESTQA